MENKEFPVKCCSDCNSVYEMDGKKIIFYQDFPKYGLEKETCCNCEGV